MASLTTAHKIATYTLSIHVKNTTRTFGESQRAATPLQTIGCQGRPSNRHTSALNSNCGFSGGRAPSDNENSIGGREILQQRQGHNFLSRAAVHGSDVTLAGSGTNFQTLPEQETRPQSLSTAESVSLRESSGEATEFLIDSSDEAVTREGVQSVADEDDARDHRVGNGIAEGATAGTAAEQGSREGDSQEGEREADAEGLERGEEAEEDDLEFEAGFKMTRVCDRLLEVFWIERPDPEEWRKLLAYSEEWAKLRPRFFKRCKERAAQMEDPKKREALFRLGRRLKEVDDDMERHNELIRAIEAADDIDTVVSRRRKDFTGEFFTHFQLMIEANAKNPPRREELASLATKCVTAVNAHDKVMADEVALENAQTKFSDILNSPDLQSACNKIDELAAKNQLDPTLMLLITKAWVTAKESNMMKDEVKDVMFHLYNSARGNMQRLVPPEVRIMRHLITMEDPREQFAELTAAFSPGDQLEGNEVDYLFTTPEKLHHWINIVLNAYYSQQEGTLMMEAQKLMKPHTITKIEILKTVIEKEFM